MAEPRQTGVRRGRPAEALPYLHKAHDLDRKVYGAPYQLGLAYRRLGRTAEAEQYSKLAETLRGGKSGDQRGMGTTPDEKP